MKIEQNKLFKMKIKEKRDLKKAPVSCAEKIKDSMCM